MAQRKGKPRGKLNLQNLKPFPKGVSGNPGGRPRYGKISEATRYILDNDLKNTYEPQTYAEKIALEQIKKAVKGEKGSAEFVSNRAEGMPTATVKSSVDLTGTNVIVDLLKPPDKAD